MNTMSKNTGIEVKLGDELSTKFYAMRLKDLDELNNWIRGQAISAAVVAGVEIGEAIRAVGSLSWATIDGKRFLQSIEGTLKVFELSARDFVGSLSDVSRVLSQSPSAVSDIWSAWSEINGMKSRPVDVEDNEDPT